MVKSLSLGHLRPLTGTYCVVGIYATKIFTVEALFNERTGIGETIKVCLYLIIFFNFFTFFFGALLESLVT